MKKLTLIKAGISLIFMGLMLSFPLSSYSQIQIEIQVSPHVLNIQNQGEVVTVHTDISYSAVEGSTVTLNGLEIAWWKSDDRGNFVAKFNMEAVKELVDEEKLELGEVTLTLHGITTEGEEFEGSETIMVIEVIPQGGKNK